MFDLRHLIDFKVNNYYHGNSHSIIQYFNIRTTTQIN